MNRLTVAALVLLGIGAGWAIISWLVETDEEQIEARIGAMTDAAVRRDIDGILDGLAGGITFDGAMMGAERRGLDPARKRLETWIGSGRIKVFSANVEGIEVNGDQATADVYVKYSYKEFTFPDHWKVELERKEDEWFVVAASRIGR